MAELDPTWLLIRRAQRVSAESRALLDQSDALLGVCARLLDHRIELLREIVNLNSHLCDSGGEAAER